MKCRFDFIKYNKFEYIPLILLIIFANIQIVLSNENEWRLWATGLPQGVYPRMVIAPNNDIFYTLLGTGIKLGYVYKANINSEIGNFIELPIIPRPKSIQNNIVALGTNKKSEVLVGVYRSDMSEPWLFYLDNITNKWKSSQSDLTPTLGGHCIATAKDGTIYVGTRWAFIYKSIDDGRTFKAIDESKILKNKYPCYYPSYLNGSENDGAIFTINIDNNGRIYAGTETAGVIYSDDEGKSWQPADFFVCKSDYEIDSLSPMSPLSRSGNVAGLGFTKNNNLVWTGVDMWSYNWKNKIGFADMVNNTVQEINGIPDYLIQTGQQVTKIVTTQIGNMYLYSGSPDNSTDNVGVYKSNDGINWIIFNNGITSKIDAYSQGSLICYKNKVFMATNDGNVWVYEEENTNGVNNELNDFELFPNPAKDIVTIKDNSSQFINNNVEYCKIFNSFGNEVKSLSILEINRLINNKSTNINIENLSQGFYICIIKSKLGIISKSFILLK